MDLIDVLGACVRRWYIVLPLLLVTGWIALTFYSSVTPVYYSNAVIGIAPSNSQISFRGDGLPVDRNGLLDVGGPELLMNLAVLGYSDPAVRIQVLKGGGQPDFTVRMFPSPITGNGPGQQLPLIMIEATEADASSAQKTVELATGQADAVLTNLQQQARVPEEQIVHALIASPPTGATAGIPSRTKSTLYIAVVGVGFALLIAVAADVLIARRRTNREAGARRTRQKADDPSRPEPRRVSARPEPDNWFDDSYKQPVQKTDKS